MSHQPVLQGRVKTREKLENPLKPRRRPQSDQVQVQQMMTPVKPVPRRPASSARKKAHPFFQPSSFVS